MKLDMTWLMVALGAAVWLSDARPVRAELADCGGIFLSGDANCEYREKEQCTTECTTTAVETACSARTYVSCDNECTATSTTTCESSCGEVCTTDCEEQITPEEPPNCMGLCVSDCKQTCEDGGRGRRGSCCSHGCNKRCEDKCKNAPEPVAEPAQCTETCSSACSGSCTAQANVECQLGCQIEIFEECETDLVETCTTKCEDEGGAIFCDGQFVNASNARSCAAELKAQFNFNIDIRAGISGAADDVADGVEETVDSGKKKSKQLCSVSHAGASGGGTGTLLLFGLLGTALGVQRLRRVR